MSTKNGFVLYFSNCRLLQRLPDEELGQLFRAIVDCAEKEARGESCTDDLLTRYPELSGEALMALGFIADNLQRDNAVYQEKAANYSAAAQRRWEKRKEPQAERQKSPPPDDMAELRKYIGLLHQAQQT